MAKKTKTTKSSKNYSKKGSSKKGSGIKSGKTFVNNSDYKYTM